VFNVTPLFIAFCCSLTYRFSHSYSACATGRQHDGHFACLREIYFFVELLALLVDGKISIGYFYSAICTMN